MSTTTTIPMSLTCERCGHTDHWLGPEGWVTFPDGWNLVYERWRDSTEAGPWLWICDDCVTPNDHRDPSFVLPLASDVDAPEIVLVDEGKAG